MSDDISLQGTFTFRRKPKPIPGDLRISWRMSLTLLMLLTSRGKKASLAKLNLLNDALRSEKSKEKLITILSDQLPLISWQMRIEPAFARNLDLLVGQGLAEWGISSGRASILLTASGIEAANVIMKDHEVLIQEKEFFNSHSKKITETFVNLILNAVKGPR